MQHQVVAGWLRAAANNLVCAPMLGNAAFPLQLMRHDQQHVHAPAVATVQPWDVLQAMHHHRVSMHDMLMMCAQVMPQLLNFLNISPDDEHAPDWGTIAVYSCAASCHTAVAYTEEHVWVQAP